MKRIRLDNARLVFFKKVSRVAVYSNMNYLLEQIARKVNEIKKLNSPSSSVRIIEPNRDNK